jgi:hypothetical protein
MTSFGTFSLSLISFMGFPLFATSFLRAYHSHHLPKTISSHISLKAEKDSGIADIRSVEVLFYIGFLVIFLSMRIHSLLYFIL